MSSSFEQASEYRFILASKSPRRKMLFESLGFPFEIRTTDTEESFDPSLKGEEIALYLSRKKAASFEGHLESDELVITADTIVWINDHVLNKPENKEEAKQMLSEISDNVHSVFTGVCLKTAEKEIVFCEETKVYFNAISEQEIDFYLDTYKPYDKAGAYGIQEFIGCIGISRVEGDFYNVVGFPVQRFWQELKNL
jgi:septum formation protein